MSQQEEGKYQIEVSDNIAQSAWQKFRAKTRLDPSLKTQLGELDSKIKFLRCINEEIRSPLSSALSGLLVLSAKVGSKDSGALDDIKLAVLSVSDVLQQAILEDVGAEALLPRARARQSQDLFAVVSEAVGELQEERGDARITVTRDSAAPTPLPCDAQKMHAVVSNSVLCVVRAAGRDAAVGVHVQSASALVAGVEITAQVSVRRGGAPGVGGEVGALVAAMHRALAPAKSFLVSAGGILIVTTSGDGADVRVGVSIAVPRPAPVHPSAQHAPAQESPSLLPSGLLRGVKTAATEPAMRFLVVDDIEACRTSMVRRFEQSNIACDQAVDGMEAVVKVMAASEVARNYDAILLDDAMPILCGARAARMMREFGFAGLIYGLTEEVGSSDSGELEAAGMNKVFAKPLSPAIFDEIVAGTQRCVCFIHSFHRCMMRRGKGADASIDLSHSQDSALNLKQLCTVSDCNCEYKGNCVKM